MIASPDQAARDELRLAIYRLNAILGDKKFICVGPGQWGANNPNLGVHIDYSDIYKAAALVEIYGKQSRIQPDPALGTYAFQDLMEAHIYPLTVSLDQPGSHLNHAFFYKADNQIEKYFSPAPVLAGCLQLIEVESYAPGCQLEISMDDEKAIAIAYLRPRRPGIKAKDTIYQSPGIPAANHFIGAHHLIIFVIDDVAVPYVPSWHVKLCLDPSDRTWN